MAMFLLQFLSLYILWAALLSSAQSEMKALLDAKKAFVEHPSGLLSDWSSENPIYCNWTGVTCEPTGSAVIGLNLSAGSLGGSIPSSLTKLSQLQSLDLSSNQLTGPIPVQLKTLPFLSELLLYSNQLTGTIPEEIGTLSSLQILRIGDNAGLSGTIPDSIGDLHNLTVLGLAFCNLTGRIPSKLGQLSQLQNLNLQQNQLEGSIPSELGNCSNLIALRLGLNKLNGSIPPEIGDLSNLRVLNLANNSIGGTIPTRLGELVQLNYLNLMANQLTGTIPKSLFNLVNLEILDLSVNNLQGEALDGFSQMSELNFLALSQNNLSGLIPDKICNNGTSLEHLMLSANNFSGEIPANLAKCCALKQLDLANNSLTGTIPPKLGELYNLTDLLLNNNSLSGPIPSELFNLANLKTLSLYHNSLHGELTEEIGKLSCAENNSTSNHSALHSASIAIIFPKMTLSILLLLIALGFSVRRRYSARKSRYFKWDTIMNATCNLNDECAIGSGGSGTIYKAELQTGETVAVQQIKALDNDSLFFREKSFPREVKILSGVRHKHLVNLLGFTSNGNGSNFLVYEYMENGSVYDWLHKPSQKIKRLFEWERRLKIAIGLAEGVKFLHHDCTPRIFHSYIKSSNLLLDGNMDAHLGDFRLAKAVSEAKTNNCLTKIGSSFAGSHGYIAPECADTLKATEESDVYSMGIVFMELVTGLMPTDRKFEGQMDMVRWVETLFDRSQSGRLHEKLFDYALQPLREGEEASMREVIKIALQCTKTVPAERPSSTDVPVTLSHVLVDLLRVRAWKKDN